MASVSFFFLLWLMALSVVSINCNGLRDQQKRAGFLQWLRGLPCTVDVVCVQEAHCVSSAECESWFRSSGFSSVVSPGSNKSCGVIILFRPVLSFVRSWADSDGRFLQCEFQLHDKSFRVVSLYAPNRNPARDQFFDLASCFVDPSVPTLLCRDLNTVFDRALDRSGSDASDSSRESTAALVRFFDSSCVIDAWRYLHPSSSCFTWFKPDGSLSSRIDFVGCPFVWISSVSSCDIVPCPSSDHCAVVFCVSVPDVVPPSPGLWKLNISVLEEEGYVDLVTNFWMDWRQQKHCFSSLAKWWESGKSGIKGLSINYCSSRSSAFSGFAPQRKG